MRSKLVPLTAGALIIAIISTVALMNRESMRPPPTPAALNKDITELSQQLDSLDKKAVWERRRLVKQIDDLKIELAELALEWLDNREGEGYVLPIGCPTWLDAMGDIRRRIRKLEADDA